MIRAARLVLALGALGACKSAPTETQIADVRARFARADEADREPDREFREELARAREMKSDSTKECPTPWTHADGRIFAAGIGALGVNVEFDDHPASKRFVQMDNVTIAGPDAAIETIGSASRQRRRELEKKLLERQGDEAKLDGKAFALRATSILDAPLPRELFVALAASKDATMEDAKTFTTGSGAGRAFLYDHDVKRFTCAGVFTAESSDVVRSRLGRAAVNGDLYVNIVEAAKDSLHAL